MHQSGKIVACCSAALSVAAITSFVTLSVVSPWMGASRIAPRQAVSEQAKTPPGGAATPSEQVLALPRRFQAPTHSLPRQTRRKLPRHPFLRRRQRNKPAKPRRRLPNGPRPRSRRR